MNANPSLYGARNHLVVADSSSADVDLVTSNPAYVAGDKTTHKPSRVIAVGGAGTLIVRYVGQAADATALTFGGAAGLALGIPFIMDCTQITASGSTATNVVVWY
ncbi:MAG: hypothetical protein WC700_10365 [Gemmatimonadaceae bacterium]|jgi:hypothetical protein